MEATTIGTGSNPRIERWEVTSGDEDGECNVLLLNIDGEEHAIYISDDDTEQLAKQLKKVIE